MKIQEIQICNFKNYCGLHQINLRPESNKKPIILIGGKNGAGKTTIFDAIKLCMFGSQFQGKTLPQRKYNDYLRSAKNMHSISSNDHQYFIQISLLLDDVFPIYSVTLRREWKMDEHKRMNEHFTLLRDGIPLEIVSHEYWQDYITSIIPPYITDYFFFDGERLAELTSGENAEEILMDAARDLIGLKQYETLNEDLTSLEKKINRKTIKNQSALNRLQELEDTLAEKIPNLEANERIMENLKNDVLDEENEIFRAEGELQRKAGAIAKERQQLTEGLANAQERVTVLTDEIAEVCNYTAFVLAGDLTSRTVTSLKKEKIIKEQKNSRIILEMSKKRILDRISSLEVEVFPSDYQIIISEIITEYDLISQEVTFDSSQPLIHDVNNETLHRIEQLFQEIEEKGRIQLKEKLNERQKLEILIKKLATQLKTIPDDSIVKDELKEIIRIKDEISLKKDTMNSLRIQQEKLNETISELKTELEKIEIDALKGEEDLCKISICGRVKDAVDEFVNYMLATRVHELEELIIKMHSQLENKDDLISSIRIDPETLNILIYDKSGNEVQKNLLSAGEKEIFALSILWALSRLGKATMPVIVDSLLARLDSDHVEKVATYFLPKAGQQVILLSHNREVDENLYNKLQPCISRSYLLSYNQGDKISEGYFFPEVNYGV